MEIHQGSDSNLTPPNQSESMQNPADGQRNLEDERREVFQLAMMGNWDEVLQKYKNNPLIRKQKITNTEDTLLHIAVTDNRKDIFTQLVNAVTEVEILEMKNDMEDTPLHLAAAMGKVGMCRFLVEKYQQLSEIRNKEGETPPQQATGLIESRNKEGETPLFVAALHGKKEAFLYLYSECPSGKGRDYWKRKSDGNSILHVAISGEYFGLAFDMLKKCETRKRELTNSMNEKGHSPLHVLASNPSAFESGSHLGRLETIIYSCIVVELLKETDVASAVKVEIQREDESQKEPLKVLPENYRAWMDSFTVVQGAFNFKVFQRLWPRHQTKQKNQLDTENPGDEISAPTGGKPFPSNYQTCYDFFELAMMALEVIGFGYIRMQTIKERKQKHTWAVQIMKELFKRASSWEYNTAGSKPQGIESRGWILPDNMDEPPEEESISTIIESRGWILPDNMDEPPEEESISTIPNSSQKVKDKKEDGGKMTDLLNEILNIPAGSKKNSQVDKNTILMTMENKQPHMYSLQMEMKKNEDDSGKKQSPLLIAAKKGVNEMVEGILDAFPVAIRDVDRDGKNVVLLVVEHRQPHVYQFLLKRESAPKDIVFQKVDNEGNSALHLAATLRENKPWRIPGAALQMQWEIKWYQFVKDSMKPHFFTHRNKKGQTAMEVFTETHEDLVRDGGIWLTNTSQSCSVVAALIATVAFATATAVPGGVKQETGTPTLQGKPAFDVFAITSLVALCSSVTSLTMFLSILTSRYQAADFRRNLPVKLIFGLTSLFVSIAAILVSFCAGHFFVLENQLKFAAFPVYAITCLPITFFAIAQLPLYVDLIRSYLTEVPQRTSEVPSL